MWLLLFFSKSKRELISLIISNIVNISISILTIIFGIQGLLKGELAGSFVLLGIGLLVGGVTIFLIQKSIKTMITKNIKKESRN
jgi:small-conductance mechanosensitive channel